MVVSGQSRGRGGTQHIASFSTENTATSCVAVPLRARVAPADPELAENGKCGKQGRVSVSTPVYPTCRSLSVIALFQKRLMDYGESRVSLNLKI